MTTEERYELRPIGRVRSPLQSRDEAPCQGYEGAPEVWIDIDARCAAGLKGIEAGQEVILITWLHGSERDVLEVRPRRLKRGVKTGVFNTRSPDRPNPLGLHRVHVREVKGARLQVGPLEVINGTPIVDIKPILRRSDDR